MRSYRRNGTPIGDRRVYVVMPAWNPKVWEISGYSTWEEVAAGLPLEILMGRFGLDGTNEIVAVMPGANLRGAYLRLVDLWGANLRGANLEGANLMFARLAHADLSDADLSRANLTRSDLRFSNLEGANLEGANISYAYLEDAYRRHSDDPIPGWRVVDGRLRRI